MKRPFFVIPAKAGNPNSAPAKAKPGTPRHQEKITVPAFVFGPGRLAGANWCIVWHCLAGGTPMLVKLHANAATTPKMRAYIQ
ncbi:MAG TPA: hypothetical protein VIJ42_08225, partial [Stellaceae bacterium]